MPFDGIKKYWQEQVDKPDDFDVSDPMSRSNAWSTFSKGTEPIAKVLGAPKNALFNAVGKAADIKPENEQVTGEDIAKHILNKFPTPLLHGEDQRKEFVNTAAQPVGLAVDLAGDPLNYTPYAAGKLGKASAGFNKVKKFFSPASAEAVEMMDLAKGVRGGHYPLLNSNGSDKLVYDLGDGRVIKQIRPNPSRGNVLEREQMLQNILSSDNLDPLTKSLNAGSDGQFVVQNKDIPIGDIGGFRNKELKKLAGSQIDLTKRINKLGLESELVPESAVTVARDGQHRIIDTGDIGINDNDLLARHTLAETSPNGYSNLRKVYTPDDADRFLNLKKMLGLK